jgi:hypothetical protein
MQNSAFPVPGPPTMFEAPRPTAALLPSDDYIQPNLGHGLRIWWAFWWPTTLISTAVAMGTNIIVKRMYDDLTLPASIAGPAIKYDVYFFNYAFAFVIMGYILRKNFRHFRVALLSNHGGQGAEALPPTLRRTLRVWWTYCWRSLLYRIMALFAVSFPLGWIAGFLAAFFKQVAAAPILINALAAVAVDAAVGLFVIYANLLDEDISDFRVALLPRNAPARAIAAPAAPANLPGTQ